MFIIAIVVLSQSAAIYLLIYERTKLIEEAEAFMQSKFEKLNFIKNANERNKPTELEDIKATEKKSKDISEVKQSGWISDWDFQDGFNTLKSGEYESVSPFWFEMKNDGNLKVLAPFNNQEFVNYVKNHNVNLIPAITCFDPIVIGDMLNSQENIDRHINEIIRYIKEYNFDGIDLDYEATYLKDKELFFEFIQKLSIGMNEIEKKLVFTVLPKWGVMKMLFIHIY